tara:strand:+ start:8936 stop:9148 length:213 start_codon:yes stop_codon:yes gene_type:complete
VNWGKVGKASGERDKGTATTPPATDTSNTKSQTNRPKSKSQNNQQKKTKSATPPNKKCRFSNAVAVRITG